MFSPSTSPRAEARERGLARALTAELAAVDGSILAELAGADGRRIRAAVTIAADHLYVDVGGRTLDGPLHRAWSPGPTTRDS